jgi:hypothetical protein
LDCEVLFGLLKKTDKTFECIRKNGYCAANAGQFMVDLVVPMGSLRDTQVITFSESDFVATEVPGLQWLLNCPKLEAVAINKDGWPVPMRVPPSRAFHYRGQIPIVSAWTPGHVTKRCHGLNECLRMFPY